MSPNLALVTHIFAETAKGNGAPFLDALADTATWRNIGSHAWSGTFHGKPAILSDLLRPLGRRVGATTTLPTRIIDGGDVIVVQAVGRNATREGVPYENDYCFVIRCENDRIVAIEEYSDTQLVAGVLGARI